MSLTPPNSLKHTHKRQRIRLHTANLIPLIRLSKKLLPRTNRPLLRVKQRHHTYICRCSKRTHTKRQRRILIGIVLAHVVNEYNPCTRLESRDQGLEDGDTFDVWPVMQNPFQDVDVGGHGLGVEEIVGEEGDAGFEIGGEFLFEDRGNLGEILDDNFQVRIGICEGDVVVAC